MVCAFYFKPHNRAYGPRGARRLAGILPASAGQDPAGGRRPQTPRPPGPISPVMRFKKQSAFKTQIKLSSVVQNALQFIKNTQEKCRAALFIRIIIYKPAADQYIPFILCHRGDFQGYFHRPILQNIPLDPFRFGKNSILYTRNIYKIICFK